jgi:hypothetical protein
MQLEVLEVALPEEQEQMVLRMRGCEVKTSPRHISCMAWTRALVMEMEAL